MRIVRAADYRRMPWKNGGGSTTEVAIAPATSTLDNFDWRISMAHVATPGPFSRFPDIDRTLAVIEGAGIHITVDGATVMLEQSSAPHFFPGDVDTSATLIDGPIDDLNVMSNRTRYRHRMTRHRLTETTTLPLDADTVVIMPRGGDIEIEEVATPIGDGDTGLIDRPIIEHVNACTVHINPVRTAAVDLYFIEFWRREDAL